MTSPENRYCANCIGTLLFPVPTSTASPTVAVLAFVHYQHWHCTLITTPA